MQTLPPDRQKKLVAPSETTRAARRSLAAAFASFTQTAGSLETTYTKLQGEVGRLRNELESKNRRLAESLEENRRIRTYLSEILESLPCGVLVFDGEKSLRMMNPAAQRLLTACGDPPLPETSAVKLLGSLLGELENSHYEQEWIVRGSDGERTIGMTYAKLAARTAGTDSVVILRDITEAKQIEQERERARRTQALAEMATLLAHEIRNPLGSLELFAGLLSDALKDESELLLWINHVQAGLRALAATVNNVLHFHSQPSGSLFAVNLVRVVGETVEFLRPLARQRGMTIDLQTTENEVPILADPPRLQQAFLNISLNAFGAMQPGGALRISVSRTKETCGPTVAVAFADQGTGIRPENLGKIFATGFTTHPGSPGIGLAVTRQFVEQHSGTIRVDSQEGRGTTFTLVFPIQGVVE